MKQVLATLHYNAIIKNHLRANRPELALHHYLLMTRNGFLPDNFTISILLNVCSRVKASISNCKQIHSFVVRSGYQRDKFVSTGLVELYLNSGDCAAARQLFVEIDERDVIAWTSLITRLNQGQLGLESLELFAQMLQDDVKPNQVTLASTLSACAQLKQVNLGKSIHGFFVRFGLRRDVIIKTAFLDMYAKCRNLIYARRVFDRMGERNMISWNIIISAYISDGQPETARQMFRQMIHSGIEPYKLEMLALVLRACTGVEGLRHVREIHCRLYRTHGGKLEIELGNSLLDMYVKNCKLDYAILMFRTMPEKNVITWTTMIMGHGMHGLIKKALGSFRLMYESGIKPDEVTFLAVLSSCSHAGLVEEGLKQFRSMQQDYNIVPEMKHFASMVDMYGRAGRLKEAYNFIQSMPIEPTEIVWTTFLAACRNHNNLEFGEFAARKALGFNQQNVGTYVLLSHIYAATGNWHKVSQVKLLMKELGLKPDTACSSVELNGKVFKFTVGDYSHPFSVELINFLQTLVKKLEESGYIQNTSVISRDISDKEKMHTLCGHSEKLALAFALNICGSEMTIRINKNIRVCGDCHEFFKFTSQLFRKEVFLKDPNRYHHFNQGVCSCGDYW